MATSRSASGVMVGLSLDGIADLERGCPSRESVPSRGCLHRKKVDSYSWNGRESHGLSKASRGSSFASRSRSLKQDWKPPRPSQSKSVQSPSSPYPGYSRENEFLLQLLGRPRQERSLPLQATAAKAVWQRLFQIKPPVLPAYLESKILENGLSGQCRVA